MFCSDTMVIENTHRHTHTHTHSHTHTQIHTNSSTQPSFLLLFFSFYFFYTKLIDMGQVVAGKWTLATLVNMAKYALASSDFGLAISSSKCLIPSLKIEFVLYIKSAMKNVYVFNMCWYIMQLERKIKFDNRW